MKVLVTGASGFIGSNVVRKLIAEECEVYALIRPTSNTWRLKDVIHSVRIVPCDLSSTGELDKWLKQILPELCIHLAWFAEPGKYLNSPENLRCLSESVHLVERLANLGCRRFVGTGTCFEYDLNLGYFSEESVTKPRSLYSASKLALQLILEQLGRVTGMEVAWVRLFYQYGPFEDHRRLVPSVTCSLLRKEEVKVTKGEQIRDFLHVEDVAAAIWAVAGSNLSGPINIGSGKPVAVRDMVTRIGTILDRLDLIALDALPYSESDPMFICANNCRLTEHTTWVPRYNLEQGLRHTIAWWQRHLGYADWTNYHVVD